MTLLSLVRALWADMAELRTWRTEGQVAIAESNHGGYILRIRYRVSQTHVNRSQLKKFFSTDYQWPDGRQKMRLSVMRRNSRASCSAASQTRAAAAARAPRTRQPPRLLTRPPFHLGGSSATPPRRPPTTQFWRGGCAALVSS